MKISKITPGDPRLTAYALGELDAAEHVAVEAAIKNDPAAQAAVAQIRSLGGDLSAALAKEPLPFVVPPPQLKDAPTAREAYHPRKFWRLPFYLVGGLAAACVAVMFVVSQQQVAEQDKQLAAAKAEALQQKKIQAAEKIAAAAAAQNRAIVEVELKNEGEPVVHVPATVVASVTKPVANEPAPAQPTPTEVRAELTPTGLLIASNQEPAAKPPGTFSVQLPEAQEKNEPPVLVADASSPVAPAPAPVPAGGASVASADAMIGSGTVVAQNSTLYGDAGAADEIIQLSAFSVEPRKRGWFSRSKEAKRVERRDSQTFNTEAYAHQVENVYLDVAGNPLSTFSIDVDTASYANMRRFLNEGQRPPRDAVRIEEMVNYFPYSYAAPKDDKPFATSMEVASAPWNPQHRLVRIGLKGREVPESERPAMNLVFLLDVSGSMDAPNKLPLVKESMRLLVEKLKPTDRVAIVVYAGASGLALPSTPVAKKAAILAAIDELNPGGSTNGAMGIQLAYDIAKANFLKDGANRVVLCTDGDFNVGVTNDGDLTRLIEEKAESGVFLTALGFGMGNYKDSTLEGLADKGNGNYGYVDNFAEAKKLLAEQLSGTLVTIAKDVKIQVEFNPAQVKSYRLIGYENRMLKKEDFNNDKIDAGEIGAGHTVTALYEVVPVGVESATDVPAVDPRKYQAAADTKVAKNAKAKKGEASNEMLTLKIRYKAPDGIFSKKLEFPLLDQGTAFANASLDFKFAAAVAGFGMLLRESPHKGTASYDSVLGWAEGGLGEDKGGHRHEFMDLVKKAQNTSG